MGQSAPPRAGRLDGPGARIAAGLVLLAVAASLLAMHWSDLFPGEAAVATDPAAACIAQRKAEIAEMIAENPSMESRRSIFEERAEGYCRATQGTSQGGLPGGPPPPPGQ